MDSETSLELAILVDKALLSVIRIISLFSQVRLQHLIELQYKKREKRFQGMQFYPKLKASGQIDLVKTAESNHGEVCASSRIHTLNRHIVPMDFIFPFVVSNKKALELHWAR